MDVLFFHQTPLFMKRLLLLFLAVFVAAGSLLAQRTVQGAVTDDAGEPLIGATVIVEGTTIGTVTDNDGNYTIEVPEGYNSLVFSYTGYSAQEVELGVSDVVNVALVPGIQLEEAVVTAVGIERSKRALGYAVSEVNSEQVQQRAETDIIRTLTGKVPGVNITGSNGAPGASTNIIIRGNSSILGNNQPLFVVDGIPFDNTSIRTQNSLVSGAPYSSRALDIDPNDIESISVLKGAAASALYGSRAANGVISITTKSGKGIQQKGLEVTVKSSFTKEEVANIPEYQNRFGQGGTTGGGSGIFSNAFFGSWGPGLNDIDSITDWKGVRRPFETFPNSVEDFFESGENFENSINISKGGETSSMSFTFSNSRTDGFIPNSELERYNLRVGANTQLDNGLFASGSLSYINTRQQGPPTGGGGVVRSGFSTQLWYLPRSYDPYQYPYIDENNRDNHYRTGEDHPLFSAFENPFSARVTRLFANAKVGYDITNWLNVQYQIGFDTYNQKNEQVFAASSQYAPTGNITVDDFFFRSIESNFLVTFNTALTDNIRLNAIIGHNFNQREGDRQSFSGTGITVFGIDDLDNTQNVVPNGGTIYKRRLAGIFGDISLSYKNYLFLNLTGRNDWSSTLPINDNSFFYPAATLGFVFTDAFHLQSDILSFGKLRFAYGRVGNDAPVYSTQELLFINGNFGANLNQLVFPFNNQPGLTLSNTLGNPALTPEFTREFELGTELRLLKNRIGLDVTVYDRETSDQIFSVNRAPSSGFLAQVTNAGVVSNRGIEVGLDVTPIELTSGLRWNFYATYTKVDNNVKSLIEGVTRIGIGSNFTTLGTYAVPGQPYGVIQGSSVARDEDGNYLINPSTGYWITNPDNTIIIGNPNPDFITSLANTVSFKGFTVRALLDWKEGGDLFTSTVANLRGRGTLQETAQGDIRQQSFVLPGFLGDPNNPGTPLLDENDDKIPNNIYIDANDYFWRTSSNAPSEFSVYDATVIRLREVSLGYELPTSLLDKTGFIGSAKIELIGRNLWFNAPNMPNGYDPETNGRGSGNAQGMEFAYVPNARRYGVSLSVTF
jgi:TonB-linked SusC/RagA family outer membrane protein